ncbi:hypothetical protein HK405_002637, partial [Cladochytrium tenue]
MGPADGGGGGGGGQFGDIRIDIEDATPGPEDGGGGAAAEFAAYQPPDFSPAAFAAMGPHGAGGGEHTAGHAPAAMAGGGRASPPVGATARAHLTRGGALIEALAE